MMAYNNINRKKENKILYEVLTQVEPYSSEYNELSK